MNRKNQISDEDIKKISGGIVSKVIFDDGSVQYRANESDDENSFIGPTTAIIDDSNGEPVNCFNNKSDAEKFAKEHGWSTNCRTYHLKKYGRDWNLDDLQELNRFFKKKI